MEMWPRLAGQFGDGDGVVGDVFRVALLDKPAVAHRMSKQLSAGVSS
jgi:hypothetical protein